MRAKPCLTSVFVAAALAVAGNVCAQPPTSSDDGAEMPTDRPGFNAPAAVIGARVVQLELGWGTARLRDRTFASAAPQPLLRVGLASYMEVQVASP